MYFKLKEGVGNHAETDADGNVTIYRAKEGKVIKSNVDLAAKFPDKFVRVQTKAPVQEVPEEEIPEEEIPDEPEEDEDEPDEEPEPLGKDATDKFPLAGENDLSVFYARGKGYYVTEADDPFTALNKKGLKKDKVEAYIKKYLKG